MKEEEETGRAETPEVFSQNPHMKAKISKHNKGKKSSKARAKKDKRR